MEFLFMKELAFYPAYLLIIYNNIYLTFKILILHYYYNDYYFSIIIIFKLLSSF